MIWQFIGRIFHSLFCLIRWSNQHVGRSLIIGSGTGLPGLPWKLIWSVGQPWSDLCLLNVHPDIDHCWNVALNCWLLAINGGVEWVSSFLKVYQYRWGYSVPLKVYLTLPYHMGKTLYHLVLRSLTGPMRIPELTVRLQNPQVQYSLGSIPKCGTIPLPSEGLLTLTYPLTRTLSISKRTSAWKHISTSMLVTMTSKTPNQ